MLTLIIATFRKIFLHRISEVKLFSSTANTMFFSGTTPKRFSYVSTLSVYYKCVNKQTGFLINPRPISEKLFNSSDSGSKGNWNIIYI